MLLGLSWRAWRRNAAAGEPGPGSPLLGAAALAGAHLIAHVLLKDGPPAAPWADRVLSAEAWLFWIVLAAGVVATFEATRAPGSPAVWLVRIPLAAATVALVLRAKLQHTWEGAEAATKAGGLFLALVVALAAASRGARHRGPAVPVLIVLVGSALAVSTGLSRSAFLAQLAGGTTAAAGAAAVLAFRARRLRLDGGASTVLVVALGGVLLSATFYSKLPPASAGLFACVPLALGLAELGPLRARPRLAALVRWGLTLALAGAATGFAVAAYEPDPYGY